MKFSFRQMINYLAIFIIFSGALSINTAEFAEYRIMYPLIFIVLFLMIPFLKEICFNAVFTIFFMLLCVTSLLNVLIGNVTLFSFLKQAVAVLLNAIFYYCLFKINETDVRKLFNIYLRLAFLMAIIGLIQEVNYLIGFRPGYDFSWFLPTWRLEVTLTGILRVNSLLPEPAHFANVMAPAFFTAFISLFDWRNQYLNRRMAIVIIIAFLLSFSSVGFIAVFISILLFAFNYRKIKITMFALFMTISFFLIIYSVVPEFRVRFDDSINVIRGRTKLSQANVSTSTLFINAQVAYRCFLENPFFGLGLGSHKKSYEKFIGSVTDISMPLSKEGIEGTFMSQDAFSLFLRLLSETGFMGIGAFFIFIILCYIRKPKQGAKDNLWVISNAVVVFFFIKLLRMGHYFVDGFFFFIWVYYFAKKHDSAKKTHMNKGHNHESTY